jgi:hypothetical protein
MKNINLLLVIAIGLTSTLFAQSNVKLEINHMQGSSALAMLQNSTTQSGESYNANRLEYYVSGISLEHDGGMVTDIDSFWILVNGFSPSTVDLGQYTITTLEAIHFFIGIEPSINHLDPSQWITGHPLAPKSPSMHWGWSAGYRFFAMEGKCGSSLSFIYELHSLGDNQYFKQRIETSGADDNGDLLITLNADYDRVFDDIILGSGVIDHGDFPKNVQFLRNVRDRVFTSSEGNGNSLSPILSVDENLHSASINLYPNPSADGKFNIVSADDLSGATISLYDNLGRRVERQEVSLWTGSKIMEIDLNGQYFVIVSKNDQVLLNEAIIIQ